LIFCNRDMQPSFIAHFNLHSATFLKKSDTVNEE
jgi:hypothetical protein